MSSFLRDLRLAVRSLLRDRTYSLAAILTLALAIGANTAIFSLIRAVVFQPLPLYESDRLVRLYEASAKHAAPRNVVNPGNFLAWKDRAKSFESLAAYVVRPFNLAGSGEPERVQTALVTEEFFTTLGARPLLGRLIGPSDGLPESASVVVLSEELWRRRFAADPAAIGREIRLEGNVATVIGVAPPRFPVPGTAELWAPLPLGPSARSARGRYLAVIGRLAPGVALGAARQELAAVAAGLAQEEPARNSGWSASVFTLREELAGSLKGALTLLFSAVGLVLLIACANVTGLRLAREAERERDSALRLALGASRASLTRQSLAECLPLALAGGLLGLAFAGGLLRLFLALSPLDLPRYATVGLDGAVLAFTAAVALFSAFASSLVPALRQGRGESLLLRTGELGARRGRGRALLVAAQVALSTLLLCGAFLVVRGLGRLSEVDPGFHGGGLLTFQVSLPAGGRDAARDPARLAQIFGGLEQRLRELPGVESAGGIDWLPLGGQGSATSFYALDRPEPAPGEKSGAAIRVVTPGLLPTLGVPLLAGRLLDQSDHAEAPPRALISQQAARELWPGGDPLGQRLRVSWNGRNDEPTVDVEIVGVVGDVRLENLADTPRSTLYFAQEQLPSRFMSLMLRTDLPASALAAPLRELVAQIDPDLPLAELRPMPEVLARGLRAPRFSASLLTALATLALLLASVGLYGLVAQRVAQRKREVGLRLALGATPRRVFGEVLRDGLRPAIGGLGLGLAAALAAAHWPGSQQLLPAAGNDFVPFLAAFVVLGLAALAAGAWPAFRATRIPPMVALRGE